MKVVFNEVKATQLAALVLESRGGSLDLLDLMKILYCIDREVFLKFHKPFIGDKYVAMEHGMVLSETYNLMKGEKSWPPRQWSEFIIRDPESYSVSLKSNPGIDEFSKAEMELVAELINKYGSMSRKEIINEVHHKQLPEWVKPEDPVKQIPVSYEEMLTKAGVVDADITKISHRSEVRSMFECVI